MLIDHRLVEKIYRKHYKGSKIVDSKRLMTGHCHYVYYVEDNKHNQLIIRIASGEGLRLLKGSVFWLKNLLGLTVPIPKIIYSDLVTSTPYLIYEFYPGRDLGYVYEVLSDKEKEALAYQMIDIQQQLEDRLVARYFNHYGYLTSFEDSDYYTNWKDVVKAHLDRSYNRINENGVFSSELVKNVYPLYKGFCDYMATVEPIPFLDDATTKNVLIHEGALSGVIDIDVICFGDPMYQIALTHMSLLAHHNDTKYTDFWLDILKPTDYQKEVFYFYVLCFCLDFMSEAGTHFNREEPLMLVDEEQQKLLDIYQQLYQKVNKFIVSEKFNQVEEAPHCKRGSISNIRGVFPT